MNLNELTESLIQARKAELYGYAKIGKDTNKSAKKLNLSIDEFFELAATQAVELPFTKAGCIAMSKLYQAHPLWAESASNVVIADLTNDEAAMLESLAIEGMASACTELGMDSSFLYQDNTN